MAAESQENKKTGDLSLVPDDISVIYIKNFEKLSSKALDRGVSYYTESYVHEISIRRVVDENDRTLLSVTAKCWRSMAKSRKPHSLNFELDLNTKDKTLIEPYCSCKAG